MVEKVRREYVCGGSSDEVLMIGKGYSKPRADQSVLVRGGSDSWWRGMY